MLELTIIIKVEFITFEIPVPQKLDYSQAAIYKENGTKFKQSA